jgi:hypothetical protein
VGCYINGEPWWPKPYFTLGPGTFFKVSYGLNGYGKSDTGAVFLEADIHSKSGFTNLEIFVPPPIKIGNNLINNEPTSDDYIFLNYDTNINKLCMGYKLDTSKTRRFTITRLDTTARRLPKVSGTFEFTAFNKCGDTLRFTKGRFDY